MLVRWLFAWMHLLGLGIGLGAVWARARALRGPLDAAGLRRVFHADGWWGAAGVIWIGTGLVRMIGGLEKGMEYYLQNHVFWGKMTLLLVLILLEIGPAVTLVRWRRQLAKGTQPDTSLAGRFARISYAQVVLVLLMVLAATAMARGVGMSAPM
jgi:putative membrane protein